MKKSLLITLAIIVLCACGKNEGSDIEILSEVATKWDLIILGVVLILLSK